MNRAWFTFRLDPDGFALVREHGTADAAHRDFCTLRARGTGERVGWTTSGTTRAEVATRLARKGYAVTWA